MFHPLFPFLCRHPEDREASELIRGEVRAGLTWMELYADVRDGWPDGTDACLIDRRACFGGNRGGSLRVCGGGGGATGVWVLMHVSLHVCVSVCVAQLLSETEND